MSVLSDTEINRIYRKYTGNIKDSFMKTSKYDEKSIMDL